MKNSLVKDTVIKNDSNGELQKMEAAKPRKRRARPAHAGNGNGNGNGGDNSASYPAQSGMYP